MRQPGRTRRRIPCVRTASKGSGEGSLRHPVPSSPRRWWSKTGSNRRPHACKARALPTELLPRKAHGSKQEACRLVGLGRLELPTSRLSSARSNQLSYKPERAGRPRPVPRGKPAVRPLARFGCCRSAPLKKEKRRRRRPAQWVPDQGPVIQVDRWGSDGPKSTASLKERSLERR